MLLLRRIHLRQGFAELSIGAVQNGQRCFQVAFHLFQRRGFALWWLPLRPQKQFRLGQNALARLRCAFAPGRVELARLARVAMMRHQGGGHLPALLRIHASHRNQILHRHLRRDLAFPHLLLDRFRQQLYQGQAPRYPTEAAVEAARQLIQRIIEALFHLRQQPALFQRAFLRTEAL